MKKMMVVALAMMLSGCITEYYIPLDDKCMEQKIVEVKAAELKKEHFKGRSFELIYDEVEAGDNLPAYKIGVIKFDNNAKMSFIPLMLFKDSKNFEHQLKVNEEVKKIVNDINANKYVEVVYMKVFDINCYSGGGSVKVPYWLIEQEVRFKVGTDDPLFLSAFKHYLQTEGRYMKLR